MLAAVALAALAWFARQATDIDRWVFEAAADIPSAAQNAFRVVYLAGCLSVVAVLVAAAVVRRRLRLALSMVASIAVTWLVGTALVGLVDARAARVRAGFDAFGDPPDFPAVRLATAVAVLFVVAPWLTRPTRRLVYLVLTVSAVSAVLAVEGLSSDIAGSLVLGWGVAALVHLAAGSPAGTPSATQVADTLRALGVEATDLERVSGPWAWTRYQGMLDGGDTGVVDVIGRDARDATFFSRFWRSVWYKNTGADLIWSRRHQVEHWAYLLLLAGRAGARVPDLVAAGSGGRRDDALIVVRAVPGRTAEGLDGSDVTDALLDDAWLQVTRLAGARIAKGGLTARSITVTPEGRAALEGFAQASYPAPAARSAVDFVDLLTLTSGIVGVDRAVAAAERALGRDGLAGLLPVIQPAALSSDTRRAAEHDKHLMTSLRDTAAAVAGVEPPELAVVRRVSWTDLAMVVGTIVGVYLLIGQFVGLSDVGDVFASAEWGWVAVAFALSQLPQLAAAFAMVGSVMAPLPFGPVVGVQFANNFTGLVGGSVATIALVVRFLQRQGQPAAVAVSSGVLNSVASGAVEIVLLPLTLLLSSSSFDLPGGEGSGIAKLIMIGIVLGGLLAVVLLFVPRLRRRLGALVRPQWDAAKANLAHVLRSPRKAVQLFGGKLAVEILFAMVLWASVQAYGGDLSLVQLILINCVASLIGGAVPVPGGMGVIEAGLIAGMTAAGLPQDVAVAATFTHRLFTAYLPPIWGWFALAWLRRRHYV